MRGDVVRVPAQLIFLKLGADPPRKFFESIGVRYSGDGKDARPMLSQVYESTVPGLFLIGAASSRDLIKLGMNQGWEVVEHEVTKVAFRPLTARDLAAYVASREWEGRAGAYAIQGLGAGLVTRIEGDYLNVVGLPAALLVRLLADRLPGTYGFG